MKSFLCILFLTYAMGLKCQEYFQQEVNYKIDVRLDDIRHSLTGFEEIEYINNSPDQLEVLYFHIWPNAYRNNDTALGRQVINGSGQIKYLSNSLRNGWIDSLDFQIDGEQVIWQYDNENIDVIKLTLNAPISPGEQIKISTPFFIKLPSAGMSRLGHANQAYFITQWYPKPAVYDLDGWHPMPYLDIGEFYSEYGSFEVNISVPDNYTIAATGRLENAEEAQRLQELKKKTESEMSFDQEETSFPESSPAFKTLSYREENIHDFAWFADKRFNVLQGEVKLPHSGRTVKTWAYFSNHEADRWKNAIEYINDAVYYYSLWNGDYPYENCTAVHSPYKSNGGMEYPSITLIGKTSTDFALEHVIMHEVGHNWFYGILGSNERENPWMDEGLNTFNEIRYMNTKYEETELYNLQLKKEKLAKWAGMHRLPFSYFHKVVYDIQAQRNLDVPISSNSERLKGFNYSAIAYSKTGLIFYYLMEYLGQDVFDRAMKAYFEKWKFRHPKPSDLKAVFEEMTSEDLSWFFEDLMNTTKKLNYGISSVKKDHVTLRNKGQIAGPVLLKEFQEDSIVQRRWLPGFQNKKKIDFLSNQTSRVELFGYGFPDLNSYDNYARTSGIFKRYEPIEIRPFGIIERPERSSLNALPMVAWNHHNQAMLGGLLYSDLLPKQVFQYQVMPLYSFATEDFAGMGKIQYRWNPYSDWLQQLTLSASGQQFAFEQESGSYYQQFVGALNFQIKDGVVSNLRSTLLKIKYQHGSDYQSISQGKRKFTDILGLTYVKENRRRIHPYQLVLNSHGNDQFVKGTVSAKWTHHYLYNNSLDLRFFVGAFFHRSDDLPTLYNFTSSGRSGSNDYQYNELYLSRFENPSSQLLISNQFSIEDGGFAAYSPFGSSHEFLAAINLASSLPISSNIPIQFYINASLRGDTEVEFKGEKGEAFLYEGGIKLRLIRDRLEFFFPLVMSNDMEEYLNQSTNNYLQRIRFTLSFSTLNPFELIGDI